MRLLFVNYEYPPLGGGGGVALQQLVQELSDQHELAVLTSGARGLPAFEMQGNAAIYRVPVLGRRNRAVASMASMFSFLPMGYARGARLLQDHHFNFINTWFAIPSGPTGVLLSRRYRIPNILTMIGGDVYDPSKWYSPHRHFFTRAMVRWVMAHSRWHTAWSSDVRDRARALFRRNIEIDVLPMGIARPQFRPLDRILLGMDRSAFYCITIARLIRRKRLGLLLERFAQSTDPQLRLLIIGSGPEEKPLRQKIAALDLGSRVELLGEMWGEKKFQYLAACDAYISLSSHEGFGLVFLEAMACGLPIIAPVVGGQADFLVHGKTGLVLEPDGEDLVRRINELLDNPEKALEIRQFNLRHVQQYFMSGIAELWIETFERYLRAPI